MKFTPGEMRVKFPGDTYSHKPAGAGIVPAAAAMYSRIFAGPLAWLCHKAAKGKCDDYAWVWASDWLTDILEDYCPLEACGLDYFRKLDGPCVVVANHMSTLETFVLPGMLRPSRPVTFVVKKSLVEMPFFGPVMRSRDPLVVGRKSPREDLATVINGGRERLEKDISIVVFPQSTRSLEFDIRHFNTIGVKLAQRAGVPVVPLALKTDAWGQGKIIRDFGRIRRGMPVRFRFGAPIEIQGNGKSEHAAICDFISSTLADWQAQDGVNK
jgi:1-acyl-sn-glycerol-3-phosphate acyltransferase